MDTRSVVERAVASAVERVVVRVVWMADQWDWYTVEATADMTATWMAAPRADQSAALKVESKASDWVVHLAWMLVDVMAATTAADWAGWMAESSVVGLAHH